MKILDQNLLDKIEKRFDWNRLSHLYEEMRYELIYKAFLSVSNNFQKKRVETMLDMFMILLRNDFLDRDSIENIVESFKDDHSSEYYFLNSISLTMKRLMYNEYARKKLEVEYGDVFDQCEEWTYEDDLEELKTFEDSIKGLSEMDKEVARILGTGASKQDCSDELGISYKAVRCSCDRIRKYFLRQQLITNYHTN